MSAPSDPPEHGPRAARLIGAAHLALGSVLVLRPAPLLRAVCGRSVPPPTWLVRVLGARSLVQGLVITARPDQLVLAGGAAVDATHAASMLPFVAASRRHRPAAAVSAAVAAASAVAEARAARTRT